MIQRPKSVFSHDKLELVSRVKNFKVGGENFKDL